MEARMIWKSRTASYRSYGEGIATALLLAVLVAALALMAFFALSPETMLAATDVMMGGQ
jgi:hypothetical protein